MPLRYHWNTFFASKLIPFHIISQNLPQQLDGFRRKENKEIYFQAKLHSKISHNQNAKNGYLYDAGRSFRLSFIARVFVKNIAQAD